MSDEAYLSNLIANVREGDGYTVEIAGVKIAKCDSRGRTAAEVRDTWVTLTPEQVEALEQGVIVRAHRGDTMVQGPLTGLVGEYAPDVWVSDIRVKLPERIEVRERDVPGGAKSDEHRMVAGSEEFLRGPECRCGARWDWRRNECARPDPQRLVSVRAEDLESIVEDWVSEAGCTPGEFPHIDRIRAALQGETS